MKKLLFATAIAASAAAFAEPINSVNFAGQDDYNPNEQQSFFYFAGESNSSIVTNDAEATFTKHTAYYSTATDKKYLALDTEGGTLWRSLGVITPTTVGETTTYDLGSAQAVAATGTYLDTLVQFTVTEDDAPSVGEGDKLAIWLQAGEGTTNLMVKANLYDFVEAPDAAPAAFTLATAEGPVAINPGEWYRLTVKAIPNVLNTDEYGVIPAFEIYIDGTQLRATTAQFTAAMVSTMTGMGALSETAAAAISDNKLFPSLATMGAQGDIPTLQGVGFQGTGAVDEIVWTEENPLPAAPTAVDFTLTWTAGQVAAVSYTIDGTTTAINDLTTGTTTIQVDPGTEVTVAATAAAWYEISSGTGAVTVASAAANAIVTELAATPSAAGATGLPASVSTADAKEWADAKSITPAQIAASTFAEKAYLLNTDLSVEPTFEIAQIEEVKATGQEEGYWKITVQAKAGDTTLDLENINGTLKVKTGATLEALGSATSTVISASDLSFDAEGKAVIAIKGTGKNFIRATVE